MIWSSENKFILSGKSLALLWNGQADSEPEKDRNRQWPVFSLLEDLKPRKFNTNTEIG